MAKFITTQTYTFSELISMYNSFEIPNFQRPYSWTNKNIQEFWNSIISNESEYFIGNIVTVNEEKKRLSIVDGQQRLTTISLLLIVIRDCYKNLIIKNKNDENIKNKKISFIQKHLTDEERISPFKEYKKLQLGKDEYKNIYELILNGNIDEIDIKKLNENQKRFIKNYFTLKSYVEKEIESSTLSRLEDLLEKVLSLQFILIVCSSENDIYSIFEGFNSTGLGLSVADLLKNSILRGASPNKLIQKDIENYWQELERYFEATSTYKFPKFIRHHWISDQGYISNNNLYNKIKVEKIDDKKPEEIKQYVESLILDAKIYLGIQYKDFSSYLNLSEKLKHNFCRFRFLGNDQILEILLAYYKLFKKNRVREGSLIKMLKILWIFGLRTRFVSVSPSEYEKKFANYCRDLGECTSSSDVSTISNKFFKDIAKSVSSSDQFIENFVADVYCTQKYTKDRGIVTEALKALMNFDNSEIQLQDPTIEHIIPEEPQKWKIKKSDIQNFVGKFGNLTLLNSKDNTKLGNEILNIKIEKVYNKSQLKINREIKTLWKKDFSDLKNLEKAVENRGLYLTKKLEKLWSMNNKSI